MTTTRFLHWLLTAALPLLAVALAPARSAAACGDYVTGHHLARTTPAAPHHPEPAPCQGPGCSQRHDLPLAPAAPPADPGDDWACPHPLASAPRQPAFGKWAPAAPFDHPTHRPQDIFHPPR